MKMSSLFSIIGLGAASMIGYDVGYNAASREADRMNRGYQYNNGFVEECLKSLEENKQKHIYSMDELREILCNEQVYDTVVDIIKTYGEYRPGKYFIDKMHTAEKECDKKYEEDIKTMDDLVKEITEKSETLHKMMYGDDDEIRRQEEAKAIEIDDKKKTAADITQDVEKFFKSFMSVMENMQKNLEIERENLMKEKQTAKQESKVIETDDSKITVSKNK